MMCTATLQKKELWEAFHRRQTEMVITKSGRRMFPIIRIRLYHLDPSAQYYVFLEMVPLSDCSYKYVGGRGWEKTTNKHAESNQRTYMHPESPASGEHWMSQPICFDKLKLTNISAPPPGHLVLNSMHKYQPTIVVVKATDFAFPTWRPTATIVFKETEFVAVTAYQNHDITDLKIANNPFAKGFRENGHSRSRRKRIQSESKGDKYECCSSNSEKQSPGQFKCRTGEDSDAMSSTSGESLTPDPVCADAQFWNYRLPPTTFNCTPSPFQPMNCLPYNFPIFPYNFQLPPMRLEPSEDSTSTPRSFTNFSIDSILSR